VVPFFGALGFVFLYSLLLRASIRATQDSYIETLGNPHQLYASLFLTIYSYLRIFASMNISDLQNSAQEAAHLLGSLANEKRLLLLCQLVSGEKSVGALASSLDLSQSNVSQQLSILRRDGLVQTRREGQTIFYSLKGDEAKRVIEVLHGIYCCAQQTDF